MEYESLTPAQARLLDAIRTRVDRGDPAPSYRDLCAQFGWASTGTARDHLQALARKGHIILGDRRARQVRLVDPPEAISRVPLLGRVVAGAPETAEQTSEGTVPVPARWLGRGRFFALRVTGDSMNGAAILDGDTVVVREQATARDGAIIVATLHGETTVKRLELKAGVVRLLPANPFYAPIQILDGDVTVHGVVVVVLRQLQPVISGIREVRNMKPRAARNAHAVP